MKFEQIKLLKKLAKNCFKASIILMTVNYSFGSQSTLVASLDTYQQQALSAHNKLRALHHAPNLVWDSELARYAEQYANKCMFKHSATPYGENLAAGYPTIGAAVNAWYDEQKEYSYAHPGFSTRTGHFTQVVWKGSAKLGCAYVACNGKNGTPGNYLVCEYSPAGNITNEGYFENNVLPQ